MKNSKRDAATAYHEAGHAVVASCLGRRVQGATVVPNDESVGHIKIESEKPSTVAAIVQGDRWRPSRLQAEKRVMVLQAGGVAQRWYNSYSVRRWHSQNDVNKCVDILRAYAPDEKKQDVMPHYRLLHNWTTHLIMQHWHEVEAVAKALLEHRKLSGTQICDVIRTANVQSLLDAVEIVRQGREGMELDEDAQWMLTRAVRRAGQFWDRKPSPSTRARVLGAS